MIPRRTRERPRQREERADVDRSGALPEALDEPVDGLADGDRDVEAGVELAERAELRLQTRHEGREVRGEAVDLVDQRADEERDALDQQDDGEHVDQQDRERGGDPDPGDNVPRGEHVVSTMRGGTEGAPRARKHKTIQRARVTIRPARRRLEARGGAVSIPPRVQRVRSVPRSTGVDPKRRERVPSAVAP